MGSAGGIPWRPDLVAIALWLIAGMLAAAGLYLLWAARRSRDENERVRLPIVGAVGVPTCLTGGLALLLGGYHAAVYGSPGVAGLPAVPVERWWMVAGLVAAALVGAALAEAFERGTGR
ncbi:MAG: hypothetical protein DYG93_07265 [Leptolyngbya sp. PLA2]|nr:hypothetical protein [Leptolyngbya sp.]MCE7971446.1 hypothetical protein [Leptolyngbya sp. PL-A2]MCQ3940661.1 hypothetical protein [cyanobacterium CYA1]MCZ7632344.1 hypothetical protein [Phycisphaerales bacterium]MDL1903631.1 hypothetical protein [Synechococcales cyanobacterium CNB]GIK18382.1 MAG: hypothetical protein BroJett004_05460 [Planctomycetota bacterium]